MVPVVDMQTRVEAQSSFLGEPPEEVAGRLRHLPGFVFLDSSSDFPGAVSLITALPDKIVTGNISEPQPLRDAMSDLSGKIQSGFDSGLPHGGLFGAVDFDGRFTFGSYQHALLFHHDTREWTEFGGVLGGMVSQDTGNWAVGQKVDFTPQMQSGEFCNLVRSAQ